MSGDSHMSGSSSSSSPCPPPLSYQVSLSGVRELGPVARLNQEYEAETATVVEGLLADESVAAVVKAIESNDQSMMPGVDPTQGDSQRWTRMTSTKAR